ncbi:MAG: T9SS type A sorting domain-containing protein [Saprospiraceae bacterium]|nr:T9SS type A sorting domain-containing protein [Saprospiraceae bacterium]MCB9327111.1 T9SS type A sorting domain-containing protein [Lewinellaceae bacterium]HPK09948.1 peroxidase family protein [Saprospiraceae bacterium]
MRRSLLYFVLTFCSLNAISAQEYEVRAIDGFGNNIQHPEWGSSGAIMLRATAPDFADDISEPKLDETFSRPNPREISNALFDQNSNFGDPLNLSDFTWSFGQFIDHDVTFSPDGSELLDNIVIPDDDQYFLPKSKLYMFRSAEAPGTGTSPENPRQNLNSITAFIDASNVYGSRPEVANYLRTFTDGKLKVSEGNLLPWNTTTGNVNDPVDYSAPHMDDPTHQLKKFFVAGDARANENPLLTSFHTLFVREHNRLCDDIIAKHPGWNDERIYQEARRWLIGYIQNIVFNEWLPAMGLDLPEYNGYNPNINPGIMNEFSAAAFRIGHTLINTNILRLTRNGETVSQGNINLKDAFFNPLAILNVGGLDPYFQGMATQVQQDMDTKVVNDVRNFLFGSPAAGGLDLVSININRGRERGLPSLNKLRLGMGKPAHKTFLSLTGNQQLADVLESVYKDVNFVDPWVGMLAEKKINGALMGELMMHIIRTQFRNLRDGDRFYFENEELFTEEDIAKIKATTMRDIIMRNTDIQLMQDEVFKAMPTNMIPEGPELFPLSLEAAVYPNPITTNDLHVKVFLNNDSEFSVKIYSFDAKLCLDKTLHGYQGDNYYTINLPDNMSAGYYNIVISNDKNFNVVKLIKQ